MCQLLLILAITWTSYIITRLIPDQPAVSKIVVILAVLVISNISSIPWGAVAYGRYMSSYGNLEGINKSLPEPPAETAKPLYIGEGLNETVAVTRTSTGIKQFHSVGKVQSSTEPLDMRLQEHDQYFLQSISGWDYLEQ
jgi:hypothetical protein